MELLANIDGFVVLPDGRILCDCWGPGLLIEPEDFGGVEMLPDSVNPSTNGPWLGVNGDEQYRIFFIRTNCLIQYRNQPQPDAVAQATVIPSLQPELPRLPQREQGASLGAVAEVTF